MAGVVAGVVAGGEAGGEAGRGGAVVGMGRVQMAGTHPFTVIRSPAPSTRLRGDMGLWSC